jgi:hypothetical protein
MNDSLWFHGTEEAWRDLADRKYWATVQPSHLAVEREFERLDAETVQKMAPAQFYVWLHDKYFYWKYTAVNRLATTRKQLVAYRAEDPELSALEAVHRDWFQMDRDDIAEALQVAGRIPGLGPAGASGLLAVLFPSQFGTVDQFVVDALFHVHDLPEHDWLEPVHTRLFPKQHGEPHRLPGQIRAADAVMLIRILRRQASDLNDRFHSTFWTPRRVDMALWGDR